MNLRQLAEKILKYRKSFTREEIISLGARVGENFYIAFDI